MRASQIFDPVCLTHRDNPIVAFLIRIAQEFTDQAIDMHDQMIGRLFNRSERRQQEGFQQNAKAINDKVRLYADVGKALIAAYNAKTDLGKALESVLGSLLS